jgi:hypothetical protein
VLFQSRVAGAQGETPGARRAREHGPSATRKALREVVRIVTQARLDATPGVEDELLEVHQPAR